MTNDRADARLAVSRNAAKLFLERGVAGTSGDDIAAASGLSKRTIWRYFRSKESCVEPFFAVSGLRFTAALRKWPRDVSIEAFLHQAIRPDQQTPQEVADGLLAVRLVALLDDEPALRSAWLMSCHVAEVELVEVIRERVDDTVGEFDLRLCAAAIIAAIRVVDEDVSTAAIRHGQKFTVAETIDLLANAIRTASTLPICDPMP